MVKPLPTVLASFIGGFFLVQQCGGTSTAFAACSTVPPKPETFRGAKGRVDRPFAVPGDTGGGSVWVGHGGRVALTIDGCPAPTGDFDKSTDVVAIVFTPPSGGPRNALLLAHDCAGVDVSACQGQLQGSGKAACAKATILIPGGTDKGKSLAFDMPALASVNALPELAGPATIVVTRKDKPRCDIGGATVPNCKSDTQPNPPLFCVDDLFQGDPCTSNTRHAVFGNFTVLPELNSFQKLCRDSGDMPKCLLGNAPVNLRFAIDKRGNALIPFQWTGVLRARGSGGSPCPPGSDDCDRRKLRGYTAVDPFPSDPAKAVLQLPAGVSVKSFNMQGAEFVPPPAITAALSSDSLEFRLEGEAHKGKSVLRVPSCDDRNPSCAPNSFFNFTGRMQGSVGPVAIARTGQAGVCEKAGAGDEQPGGPTPTPRKRCTSDAQCGTAYVCAGFRAFAGGHKPKP
jgi:hypothetical protein